VFFGAASLALIVSVFLGFARFYYQRDPSLRPLAPLFQVHGLVMTAWVVLFGTQTALIATHRVQLHRRMGYAGIGVAILVVVLGGMAILDSARHGAIAKSPAVAASFLAVPSVDLLLFAGFVAAAFWFRAQKAAHKRLMLLATVVMCTPGFARWPFAWIRSPVAFFGLVDCVVLAAVIFDLASRRRVHPALAYGGSLLVASQPLRFVLANTEAWHRLSAFVLG
jgi:hypothetical protein